MSGVEIVEFLRARLDEDEQRWRDIAAKVAADRGSFVVLGLAHPELAAGDCPSDLGEIDPARVLREVEAKRRIVEELTARERADDSEEGLWHKVGYDRAAFDVLRLLALPYADRDGWREEWRPA